MPRSRSCSRTVLLLSWSICLLSAELFRGVLARPHHRRHKEKSPAPNGSPLSLPSSSPLSLSDSNHHVSQKRLKHARINAIKKDMLDKLGMRNAPDVSRFNTTVEESRRMLRLYKKGLEDRQGTAAHKLLEEDLEYYAKTFNSFSYEGKPGWKSPTTCGPPALCFPYSLPVITWYVKHCLSIFRKYLLENWGSNADLLTLSLTGRLQCLAIWIRLLLDTCMHNALYIVERNCRSYGIILSVRECWGVTLQPGVSLYRCTWRQVAEHWQ